MDLFLGIEMAVRTLFLQQGINLALDAKALVFRQVPVEDVKLGRFHQVDILSEQLQGYEVPPCVRS